jgi:KUP system potassium uptake protein
MSQAALTLAALGIVFGDIGTSPLYAVREAFHGPHAMPVTQENIFGVLSLIVWSLILVISVKYLLFVLRADNKGEGGVLALTALAAPPRIASKFLWSKILLYCGIFGSALLFGDGVITPAITVLGAIEGLKIATPLFEHYVIPLTVGILAALFMVQKYGTAKIGTIFGPIILLWFTVLAALGINGMVAHPEIMNAVNPYYAIQFFIHNGWNGYIVLGAVFLVVTGGEALYADMGHFGRVPIQRGWFFVALPGLLLNYFGQGALILSRPETAENPFFFLAPDWFLFPLVIISTLAAVIAAQALISGVFSLTRQAVQLGFFPRVKIIHTSSHEIGQIYIPSVNWILFILTAWLVISFGSSSALASAYGIAVSLTMVITTILACTVAMQKWHWKWYIVASILVVLLSIDAVFMIANFAKILDGGWVPLIMGTVIFILVTTWRRGRQIMAQKLIEKSIHFEEFIKFTETSKAVRIPGAAIFMSGTATGVPFSLIHNVRHNKCLHTIIAILTVVSEEIPYVSEPNRVEIHEKGRGFYRIIAKYGFMDSPDIHDILKHCRENGFPIHLSETTFFLGRETVIPSNEPGMAIWREYLFAFMSKNAERATDYFSIPPNNVIEVGLQIEI